jgi:hypothetical protein
VADEEISVRQANPVSPGRAVVTAALIYGGAIKNQDKRLVFNNITIFNRR